MESLELTHSTQERQREREREKTQKNYITDADLGCVHIKEVGKSKYSHLIEWNKLYPRPTYPIIPLRDRGISYREVLSEFLRPPDTFCIVVHITIM